MSEMAILRQLCCTRSAEPSWVYALGNLQLTRTTASPPETGLLTHLISPLNHLSHFFFDAGVKFDLFMLRR